MNYLLVTPQFAYNEQGAPTPGGLLQFGRCLARALASSPSLESLDVWCQVDSARMAAAIRELLRAHAQPGLHLRVRGFGGCRLALACAMAESCRQGKFDRGMYTLLNQAVLSELPYHPPFDIRQIGTQLFRRLGYAQRPIMRPARPGYSPSGNPLHLP